MIKNFFRINDKQTGKKNIKLHEVCKYSMTPLKNSEKILELILKHFKKKDKITIIDGTANCGADLINFAHNKNVKSVIGIELDPEIFEYLKNNVNYYENNITKKINIYNENCLNFIYETNVDVIYLDPPWGGKDYKKHKFINIYLSNMPIDEIVKKIIMNNKHVKLVVLKLPYNYSLNNLSNSKHIKNFEVYNIDRSIRIIIIKIDFI